LSSATYKSRYNNWLLVNLVMMWKREEMTNERVKSQYNANNKLGPYNK